MQWRPPPGHHQDRHQLLGLGAGVFGLGHEVQRGLQQLLAGLVQLGQGAVVLRAQDVGDQRTGIGVRGPKSHVQQLHLSNGPQNGNDADDSVSSSFNLQLWLACMKKIGCGDRLDATNQ